MSTTNGTNAGSSDSLASRLGLDRLAQEAQGLGQAFADKGVSTLTDKVDGITDKLAGGASGSPATKAKAKAVKNMAKGDSKPKAAVKAGVGGVADTVKEGASSVKDKISDAVGGGGGNQNKGKGLKVTNIVEELDLPVSREVAYQAWTQFEDFPGFMKKVENVEQKSDEEVEWKAQIFWSHRSWTAKIIDQVPNERIVWESSGEKGHVDGAVTFHELAPNLTRMLVVLEYHPQGFFEHTANLWRAQGRRVRLELKHFRRHVATTVLLHPDELDGWEGEIHDGKVTKKSSGNGSRGSNGGSSGGRSSDGRSSNRGAGSSRRGAAKTSASSSSRGASKTTKSTSSSSRPRKTTKSASSSSGSGSGSSSSRTRKTAKSASSSRSSGSGRARKTAKKSSSSRRSS
jgi:uncharacterized membrane protein